MADLNLLNALSEERDRLQEENRALTQRVQAAERKLSAIDTDQAQARKALGERDEARREARKAKTRAEVAERERDDLRKAFERTLDEVESWKISCKHVGERVSELEAEAKELKEGARITERGLRSEITRLRNEIRELELYRPQVEALRKALQPFLKG